MMKRIESERQYKIEMQAEALQLAASRAGISLKASEALVPTEAPLSRVDKTVSVQATEISIATPALEQHSPRKLAESITCFHTKGKRWTLEQRKKLVDLYDRLKQPGADPS